MRKLLTYGTRALIAAGVLLALLSTATFAMILWSDPTFATPPDISPQALADAGLSFEQPYPAAKRDFPMRDGTLLAAQYLAAGARSARAVFPPTAPTTIVLVHGILGSSFPLNRTSGLLREAAPAEVVAIDLRGHGASGGRPGDVDYIGQYEDDLGDVVSDVRARRPGGRVILAGHSMGGGIALRYAVRDGVPPVDGYLLFAPYLGWESPTTRKEATPEAEKAGAQFLAVNLPRILGLKLLNTFGVTAFNGLRTEFFNLPPELPLRSYSYRAMESGAPADYRAALAAVRAPLLLVVGSDDEAFVAAAYEPLLRASGRGAVVTVPGASHNGVLTDPRTMAATATWMRAPATAAASATRR